MKLVEAIERVKREKPNGYGDEILTSWISQIENLAQVEIMGVDSEEIEDYSWKEDGDAELKVPDPYSDIYIYYLKAMVDYNNREYNSYNYNTQLFNSTYMAFAAWYKRNKGTAQPRKAVKINNFW